MSGKEHIHPRDRSPFDPTKPVSENRGKYMPMYQPMPSLQDPRVRDQCIRGFMNSKQGKAQYAQAYAEYEQRKKEAAAKKK